MPSRISRWEVDGQHGVSEKAFLVLQLRPMSQWPSWDGGSGGGNSTSPTNRIGRNRVGRWGGKDGEICPREK